MDSFFLQLKKLYDNELFSNVLPIVSIRLQYHAYNAQMHNSTTNIYRSFMHTRHVSSRTPMTVIVRC